MIFGLWNLAKYLVVAILFHYDLRCWLDFWFESVYQYNDKLQINFEIHSGWMIFGQLTAVGLWNFVKYLVGHHFFFFTMIWDIDLIFGMWEYSDELPIKFEFSSDWMILG